MGKNQDQRKDPQSMHQGWVGHGNSRLISALMKQRQATATAGKAGKLDQAWVDELRVQQETLPQGRRRRKSRETHRLLLRLPQAWQTRIHEHLETQVAVYFHIYTHVIHIYAHGNTYTFITHTSKERHDLYKNGKWEVQRGVPKLIAYFC